MTGPPERMAAAEFSAEWLRLREPFDGAARAVAAAQPQMQAALAQLRASGAVGVLDLACGLGANLRALAPQLGGQQHWRLVDHDPALLAALPVALGNWARQQGYRYVAGAAANTCRIAGPGFSAAAEWQWLDLSRDLESLDLAGIALVSASALLDLVSDAWMQRVIGRAAGTGAAMLWALSVDGRIVWEPTDPDDAAVHALFGRHQQRDKGFGPALGPRAPEFAMMQLAQAGYRCTAARSDWHVDGDQDAPMQRALIEGIAAAALEQDPSAQVTVRAWQERRTAAVAHSRLLVGHADILATPR